MSDSRRSSRGSSDRSRRSKKPTTGGARRAAGVRRASTPTSSASKPSPSKPSPSTSSGKAPAPKGTSRTGRRAAGAGAAASGTGTAASGAGGAKRTTSEKGSPSAKRATPVAGAPKPPSARTSVRARHAGVASAAAAAAPKGRAKKAAATNFLNYPRAGAKNPWRWFPSLRLIVGAMALMVLAGLGFAVWLYNATEVPEPSDFALAQTSRVYYSDGETEMGQFSEINRTELPADEIPDNIKQAVVASEDASFYENRGVSPRGILRALINNLSGGERQGGSTITQQYVERYYTGTTTSYVGKAKEAVMALKIDQELPKDEILSRYLNTIYFGRGAYGVQEASQAYFGKDAAELTDAEAALLVAVIPGPSIYDPANNKEDAVRLWDRVITRQVAEEQMTPAEAEALEFPETIEPKSENVLGGPEGYLLMEVRKELIAQGFTEEEINTGGLTIISTIDPEIQQNTVEAVENLPDDRPENNEVGTVTIDPATGAIRGMYGGQDYVTEPRNNSTQARMQAGSIFKTFTLISALEEGFPLDSRWDGNSPKYFSEVPGGWEVSNYGDNDYGRVTLEEATAHSINTAYAEVNIEIGPEHTMETAIKLGLPEDTPGLAPVPSNVLGSASPTVEEMAEVYATIAARGVHHDPYIVESVSRSDGSTRYQHEGEENRVLDEEVAINATVALQGPPTEGSARSLQQVMDGRPVAGKTGTSESFRSAWFVGFTPQLVTAVGMFQPGEDGSEQQLTPFGGVESMTGGQHPTDIWGDIMAPSLEGQEVLEFPDEVTLDNETQERSYVPPPPPPPTTEAPEPTEEPSEEPTEEPSEEPSEEPTEEPSEKPSEEPSEKPSATPKETPKEKPTTTPGGGAGGGDENVQPTTEPTSEEQGGGGGDTSAGGQGKGRGGGAGNDGDGDAL